MKKSNYPLSLALSTLLAAPASAAAGPVSLKGSDTMVILGQRWAEAFMQKHAEVQIQVTGGGSGTGISALINGTTEVCQSSRAMKQAEKEKLRERYASVGVEIPVAKDGLSIYVHASNPVEEVSIEQLKQLYTGKLSNWKELGGPDAKIVLYSRENSSGTYVYFKEEVLGGADFSPRAQTLPGTASVANAVSKEKGGIGYGGAAYAKGVKVLKVRRGGEPAVAPDAAHVRSGTYPLSRPLYFYLRSRPSGDVQRFVDYVLSSEGQALTADVGYYPVR